MKSLDAALDISGNLEKHLQHVKAVLWGPGTSVIWRLAATAGSLPPTRIPSFRQSSGFDLSPFWLAPQLPVARRPLRIGLWAWMFSGFSAVGSQMVQLNYALGTESHISLKTAVQGRSAEPCRTQKAYKPSVTPVQRQLFNVVDAFHCSRVARRSFHIWWGEDLPARLGLASCLW